MPSPRSVARDRLAARQADLVRALTGAGEIPPGFDREQIERAACSLRNKRRVEVARVWPATVAVLGQPYTEQFNAFAARTPPPEQGGPLADGRAFLATLPRDIAWTDDAVWERLVVDLHHRRDAHGLHRRRGFAVVWARLPQSRRLVVRLRLPGGRVLAFG